MLSVTLKTESSFIQEWSPFQFGTTPGKDKCAESAHQKAAILKPDNGEFKAIIR